MAASGDRGTSSMLSMMDDPFITKPEGARIPLESNNYSSFDAQLFSLDASSPAQAKRALEAHLAETERRLEEASKLGTALVEQRKELEDKLKEVEQQQEEGQIGPDLRRKLADLEREYTEIGRETARAFLAPKRLAGGDDAHLGTPSLDHKSPLSSALFAGQATNSPSKVSVPSRKQRNQPSTRVHDIEFATEISTSLLAQVRQLQSLLAEREEALKTANLEKSSLELEAEGYAQRIRALDESEERYKDENWALETKTHELMASVKDAADRESKLNSSLGAVTAEKNAMERELEDLKQTNAKLVEEHMTAQKANDAEIHLLRRNITAGDAEKLALQRKLEDMNSQNQELAKAVAMRLRHHESESVREVIRGNDSDDEDQATPENSPPPSPNKFTPRHNHLETETLRSSLGHAHRMIQNLRSTVHREKTEKIELKRMLQEARDEIEQRRRDSNAPGGTNKRQKTKADVARKLARPDLLGAGRKKAEVEIDDSDWEDNAADLSPTQRAFRSSRSHHEDQSTDERSDAYQTATEAEDAFETANERETATESEAFQTGVESIDGDSTDSDELTETEDRVHRTPRERVSSLTLAKARDRTSYYSTASTSADEDDSEDPGTPSASQFSTPRYRLHKKRSALRKIRPSGEAPMAFGSRPSSARESPATSFTRETSMAPEGQSLFAELAELDGDEDEDGSFGPPMQFDTGSPSTPRMHLASDSRRPSEITLDSPSKPPKPAMVDSGVMTDPWEPAPAPISSTAVAIADETVNGSAPATPKMVSMSDAATGTEVVESPTLISSGTQWTPLKPTAELNGVQVSSVPTPPKMAWDGRNNDEQVEEVETPSSPIQLDVSSISSEETEPVAPRYPELSTSYFVGGIVEPIALPAPALPEVALSSISSQSSEPEVPTVAPIPVPPELSLSTISSQFSEPVVPIAAPIPTPPELAVSTIWSQFSEPEVPVFVPAPVVREVALSSVSSQFSEPEAPTIAPAPALEPVYIPQVAFSQVFAEQTLPVSPSLPEPTPEPVFSFTEQGTSTDITELSVSTIFSQETEPVEPVEPSPEPEIVLADVDEVVPEPMLPELTISFIAPEYTEPVAPEVQEVIVPPVPQLALSTVSSVETPPVEHTPAIVFLPSPLAVENENLISKGVGSSKPNKAVPPVVLVEDSTDKDSADEGTDRQIGATLPLGTISGNAAPRRTRAGSSNLADQGAQTILSSKQIDQLLMDRVSSRPLSPPESDKAKELSNSPFTTPKARSRPTPQPSTTSLQKRPGSAASQASSTQNHPPLPADHKEAILAAEKKSLEQRPVSAGLMGPPLAPASAYKANTSQRPWTPNETGTYLGTVKTNPSRTSMRRESQMSRRSSVSSFASEIEERFNMQPNQAFPPQGYGMGTDPRMIQAITQTMIGEFLWKYTRRAVSGEISNTRHRRYFWVHPYTRTLYWSEQDPQSAGKSEIRTKSVYIEAVRVVPDDNPYPPGLHCKSLEVVSPGRRIRFTATTSQRHETWFNALSYLLVRNGPEDEEAENGVSLEDIDEFNPGFRSRSRNTARMSISSQQSRPRALPKQRSGSAMSLRPSLTPGRSSPYPPSHYSDQARQTSASRLSTLLNSTIKSSFGRKGPGYAASSVNEGSLHNHDSEEDLRQMMERHEHDDSGLENVRACCDGKHDVGSLSRTSRYSPRANRIHSHHH
ncbi:anucleate primary sterigmata protein A [Aspergillus granulosus]|uniref:Anucleate primary sterigmata protein A n=1 Tax=Aspergillus granulosus TaxID=176169 RepID=A0ABR4HAT3_9EURO